MKRSNFYSIAGIVAFLFGLAFILFPIPTMTFFGETLDEAGAFMARYFGSALLGVSLILWYARSSAISQALLAINFGGLVISVTGLVVALLEFFSSVGNAMVWIVVAIYLLLSLGFGYYHFKK
ncbi:hypothetical protein ACFLTX_01970 [Chloroflexota bacterium]